MEENVVEIQNKPKAKSTASAIFDFVEMLAWVLAIVLFLTVFVFRIAVVNQSSMNQTLADGDRLVVSKLFYTPKSGDIIVFQENTIESGKPLVKRIIATEGQTVKIVSGEVYVDGVLLDESSYIYLDYTDYHSDLEVTVPEGQLFVMGDHRNVSADSRNFGCVKEESIIGQVLFRLTPLDKFGSVK